MAMAIASTYSRRIDLRRRETSLGGAPGWPLTAAGSVTGGVVVVSLTCSSMLALEDRQEGFLRDLHLADLLHALLAFLLTLEQLPLACDITTVTLGGDILAHRFHRL